MCVFSLFLTKLKGKTKLEKKRCDKSKLSTNSHTAQLPNLGPAASHTQADLDRLVMRKSHGADFKAGSGKVHVKSNAQKSGLVKSVEKTLHQHHNHSYQLPCSTEAVTPKALYKKVLYKEVLYKKRVIRCPFLLRFAPNVTVSARTR